MRHFAERVGDRVARGLRRVWDNLFVLWLGSVLGAWSSRVGTVWEWLGPGLLLAAGTAFVRWWELRRLRRAFEAAVAADGGRLTVLDGPSGVSDGE